MKIDRGKFSCIWSGVQGKSTTPERFYQMGASSGLWLWDDAVSRLTRPYATRGAACRYQMQGGESLDVTFSNIRHAFFQESDNELITLVHFTLKDPIMAGKKKVTDVQFYTEVMENNTVRILLSLVV